MNNNKQSSVEQLINSLIKLGYLHSNGFGQSLKVTEVINQAKAMHKEEHIETYNQGYRDGEHDASNIPLSIGDISEYNNATDYYNETFGGNNEN